jgi:UDP-2,4-diacetamido-2,4,6-trideoxy-beta-L-altropyranose hydrolase
LAKLGRIVLRFDASASVGAGHATRCLALADALAEMGAEVALLANAGAQDQVPGLALRHRVATAEPSGAAAVEAIRTLWREGADLAVVDHYSWAAAEERRLRTSVRRIVVIDDLADRAHDCDLLIDQNLGRSRAHYAGLVDPAAPLLLGPRYALLREPFRRLRHDARPSRAHRGGVESPASVQVLVSLGLADPGGATWRVCEALARLNAPAHYRVVMSPSAPDLPSMEALCARDRRFVLLGPQDAEAMARLLASADLAIGGAGVTAWERCALGVPSLVLVLADNQRAGASALATSGAALVFEPDAIGLARLARACVDLSGRPRTRAEMARAASEIADGRGALRAAAACGDLMSGFTLRPATLEDGEAVWRWRNSPGARAASRATDEIPLSAHLDWFAQAIASTRRVILIGHSKGASVGMVRFDHADDGCWDVSIAIDPARTGRGLGSALLKRACDWLRADRVVGRLTATAREANAASLAAFQKAGFTLGEPREGWVAMRSEGDKSGGA